jgi:hypothetical protein
MPLPKEVEDFLSITLIEKRVPAFLHISIDGHLLESGGNTPLYGVASLDRSVQVEVQLGYLAGLLIAGIAATSMRFVTVAEGVIADVHVFSNERGIWVVYLDARDESKNILKIQQQANELKAQLEYMSLNTHEVAKLPSNDKQAPAIKAAMELLQKAQDVLRGAVPGKNEN